MKMDKEKLRDMANAHYEKEIKICLVPRDVIRAYESAYNMRDKEADEEMTLMREMCTILEDVKPILVREQHYTEAGAIRDILSRVNELFKNREV